MVLKNKYISDEITMKFKAIDWRDIFGKFTNKKTKANHDPFIMNSIIMTSNVVQYDEMGYPLRLFMMRTSDGLVDHVWRDTVERDGDVVIEKEKEN